MSCDVSQAGTCQSGPHLPIVDDRAQSPPQRGQRWLPRPTCTAPKTRTQTCRVHGGLTRLHDASENEGKASWRHRSQSFPHLACRRASLKLISPFLPTSTPSPLCVALCVLLAGLRPPSFGPSLAICRRFASCSQVAKDIWLASWHTRKRQQKPPRLCF